MPHIPEPTLFGPLPLGSTPIQTFAVYAMRAALLLSAAAGVTALARCKAKGVLSHVLMGAGLSVCAGAAFVGEHVYKNMLFGEAARSATESGLFVLALGAALFASGVTLVPGFKPKRFSWLAIALPALAGAGLALAALGNMPSVVASAGAGIGLSVVGSVLAAAAGALLVVDKTGAANNPQERLGASAGFAFISLGLLGAIGSALTRTAEGGDKGTLALGLGGTCFALFALMGVLAVFGKASDFPKPVKVKRVSAPPPAPAMPPPPPGSVPPPPPRPAAPRPPVAPPPRRPGA